jgi:hypothetical protein
MNPCVIKSLVQAYDKDLYRQAAAARRIKPLRRKEPATPSTR